MNFLLLSDTISGLHLEELNIVYFRSESMKYLPRSLCELKINWLSSIQNNGFSDLHGLQTLVILSSPKFDIPVPFPEELLQLVMPSSMYHKDQKWPAKLGNGIITKGYGFEDASFHYSFDDIRKRLKSNVIPEQDVVSMALSDLCYGTLLAFLK
jgi:hypothetical protein